MILYYRSQFKKDGVWYNDVTFSPVAVEQPNAHLFIETIDLDDDTRIIRVEKSEAMDNELGQILLLTQPRSGQWIGTTLMTEDKYHG